MEQVQIPAFSDPLPVPIPLLKEKPRQGVPGNNPAPHPGHDLHNSTVAIGLRAALHLNAVRSHYTGKERDTESGNDYFGARYYASTMGRFLSPDWSAKEEPVPYAKLDDPQSLNLYVYVLNNPLTRFDLDGHGCPPDCQISTWDRVGMAVHGFLDITAGTDKLAVAGVSGLSTVVDGPVGALGAAYLGISGTGQTVAGAAEMIGSVLPSNGAQTAQTMADAAAAATTIAGGITLAATGDPHKAAAAAAGEDLGTKLASGTLVKKIKDVRDTVLDMSTLHDTPVPPPPPQPPPPPPPPTPPPPQDQP
jgi:RHS repeat-associated protein